MTTKTFFILTLTTVVFSYFTNQGYSQNLTFTAETGIAAFSLDQLHSYQDDVVSSNSLYELKITDSFPARPYFRLQLTKVLDQGSEVGLFATYTGTSGRMTRSDFSGSVYLDQVLISRQIGITGIQFLDADFPFQPVIRGKISVDFTTVDLESKMVLQQHTERQSTQLQSVNFYFEPGLGARFSGLPMQPTITAGYLFGIVQRPLHLKGERDSKMNLHGENVVSDFSGFRIGLSVDLYRK